MAFTVDSTTTTDWQFNATDNSLFIGGSSIGWNTGGDTSVFDTYRVKPDLDKKQLTRLMGAMTKLSEVFEENKEELQELLGENWDERLPDDVDTALEFFVNHFLDMAQDKKLQEQEARKQQEQREQAAQMAKIQKQMQQIQRKQHNGRIYPNTKPAAPPKPNGFWIEQPGTNWPNYPGSDYPLITSAKNLTWRDDLIQNSNDAMFENIARNPAPKPIKRPRKK
jgi:hypothetical protein